MSLTGLHTLRIVYYVNEASEKENPDMAYISTSEVSQIRKALKAKFPKFKFSVRKDGGLAVNVSILSGPTDFSDIMRENYNGHVQVNHYHTHHYGDHAKFLDEVINVIKTGSDQQWYNNSDSQIDYFDVAFYFDVEIGKSDKPYQMKG